MNTDLIINIIAIIAILFVPISIWHLIKEHRETSKPYAPLNEPLERNTLRRHNDKVE